jgi:uncharacterized protein Yka (UPF0111/DUF47 family)
MSADTPSSHYEALKRRFDQLTRTDAAKAALDAINTLEQQITDLPTRLNGVRSRGYAFAAHLESAAESLRDRWFSIATDLKDEATRLADDLRKAVETVRNYFTKADNLSANPEMLSGFLPTISEQIEQLEAQAKAIQDSVRARFEAIDAEAKELLRDLSRIDGYLSDIDKAAFTLESGEAVFITASAEWIADERGKEKPNGILYLTDQRLIFQQDEKVGKRLGLFGGSSVQEVRWIIPISGVTNVRSENKGLLGGKDMVYIASGGAETTIEVKGGVAAKWWVEQIERARSGNLDRA